MANPAYPPPAPPGIRCPKCGARDHELKYVRQRPNLTRRFRHCHACGKRFRTTERAD